MKGRPCCCAFFPVAMQKRESGKSETERKPRSLSRLYNTMFCAHSVMRERASSEADAGLTVVGGLQQSAVGGTAEYANGAVLHVRERHGVRYPVVGLCSVSVSRCKKDCVGTGCAACARDSDSFAVKMDQRGDTPTVL